MLVQKHDVAVDAVRHSGRVRGVGAGILNWILDPIDAAQADLFTGTVDRLPTNDGGTPGATGQPVIKQTFAGAFGGALGQTTGKALVWLAVIGGALWYLNKQAPKFLK